MFTVAALYQFAPFGDPAALRQPLLDLCTARGICGTILLAGEGINGTIAGSADGIAAVIAHIRALPGCSALDVKYSSAAAQPFQRLKVRLKREIVTLKVPGIDPARDVGTYVDPADWNAVIDDPATVVIDTRNAFEVGYGSFAGAIDPGTTSFGEFPDWWRANAERFAGKRVAMGMRSLVRRTFPLDTVDFIGFASVAERIENAGAIFVGAASAEAFGDYICGPSHVLPTDASARVFSGVTTASFMKGVSVQKLSKAGASRLAAPTARLARLEGLEAHALSAERRR